LVKYDFFTIKLTKLGYAYTFFIYFTEARITPHTQMQDNIPYGQKVDNSQFTNMKKCSDPPK
jgi:hypothetical protein